MGNSPGKPVKLSQSESAHLVLPSDANALDTIFGGRIMAWADLAASIVAFRHTRQICVTASMDELHFISPVKVGEIVILKASVNYTHKTSLEIGVRVESEDPLTGERKHTASAYLTFVAIDANRCPIPVPPVIPETADEKRRYREAEERRNNRLAHRAKLKAERAKK
jgi:acyl-CoA hydrolase